MVSLISSIFLGCIFFPEEKTFSVTNRQRSIFLLGEMNWCPHLTHMVSFVGVIPGSLDGFMWNCKPCSNARPVQFKDQSRKITRQLFIGYLILAWPGLYHQGTFVYYENFIYDFNKYLKFLFENIVKIMSKVWDDVDFYSVISYVFLHDHLDCAVTLSNE